MPTVAIAFRNGRRHNNIMFRLAWSGVDRDAVKLSERWNGTSRTSVVWCSLRHVGCPVIDPDFERGWRISFGAQAASADALSDQPRSLPMGFLSQLANRDFPWRHGLLGGGDVARHRTPHEFCHFLLQWPSLGHTWDASVAITSFI